MAVLHYPTINPLDEASILEAVRYKHRLVVVAENQSIVGGLAGAVSSALLRNRVQPAGFELAGLPDQFLDAGALLTSLSGGGAGLANQYKESLECSCGGHYEREKRLFCPNCKSENLTYSMEFIT
jgi:transketolase C-terminal domain/subunit